MFRIVSIYFFFDAIVFFITVSYRILTLCQYPYYTPILTLCQYKFKKRAENPRLKFVMLSLYFNYFQIIWYPQLAVIVFLPFLAVELLAVFMRSVLGMIEEQVFHAEFFG